MDLKDIAITVLLLVNVGLCAWCMLLDSQLEDWKRYNKRNED